MLHLFVLLTLRFRKFISNTLLRTFSPAVATVIGLFTGSGKLAYFRFVLETE